MTDSPLRPSPLAAALASLAFLWILVCAFGTQLYALVLPAFSDTGTSRSVALLTALFAGLIAVPLLPLALLLPPSRGRAAVRAWLVAAVFPLLLALSRLLAPAESQLVLLAQVGISLLFALVLWVTRVRQPRTFAPAALALAVGMGALVAAPWLALGVLGSPLDTLLAVVLGLLVGVISAQNIDRTWVAFASAGFGRSSSLLVDGLVYGAVLMILVAGLLSNGAQIPLMIAIPALGWVGAALTKAARNWRPMALLVGIAVAAAAALIDTDGTGIVAGDPINGRVYQAAVAALLIGWALTFVVLLARGSAAHDRRALPWIGGAAALWLAALGLYAALGQPGFYGDRLFVIMKGQADVSQAATITNYDERRTFVYRTLTAQATTAQADLRATLDRFGVAYTPFYLVDGVEVQGGAIVRLLLQSRGDIDRVLPSPRLRPLPTPPEPMVGDSPPPQTPQWNLTNIGADKVWNELGVRGKGVTIGQSDSGVQWTHPELQATYRGQNGDHDYNWLDPWTNRPTPFDDGGHGTHTLGSIVGKSVGVAPEAQWIACANLERNIGDPALYLDCMQFMLAPYPRTGNPFTDGDPTRSANVLNNSWGCPQDFEGCDPGSLQPAVAALGDAGIFVVASAGNSGPTCASITDPLAIYAGAFSVGAIDQDNNLGSFSSVGPVTVDGSGRVKPDILAPGVDVLSSLPDNTYGPESGTSMAGPHVAGVVALMWSANPQLIGDIARTRQILAETATPFKGTIVGPNASNACLAQTDLNMRPNAIAGYGIVNAYAAVKAAQAAR